MLILYLSIILLALIFIAGFVYLAELKAKENAAKIPRFRACPVCGKELAVGENILAEKTGVVKDGRERIIIKGCEYCLKRRT